MAVAQEWYNLEGAWIRLRYNRIPAPGWLEDQSQIPVGRPPASRRREGYDGVPPPGPTEPPGNHPSRPFPLRLRPGKSLLLLGPLKGCGTGSPGGVVLTD